MTDTYSSFSTSKIMSLSTHRSYMTWDWPGIDLRLTWNLSGIDLEFAWNRAKKVIFFFFLPGFHLEWPGITRGWLRIWHLIFFILFTQTEVGIYLESHQIPTILLGSAWIPSIPPGSRWNQWGRVKYCFKPQYLSGLLAFRDQHPLLIHQSCLQLWMAHKLWRQF